MSNGAPSGISASEVHSLISSLESRLRSEIGRQVNDVRAELRQEIARLEREMIEIGRMIVKAINDQTNAVVGGVAATTLMIERTKQQIEADFLDTRNKLDLQIESTMQIEIGKKVAEASASRSKLEAFAKDLKGRFQRSIEASEVNRQLYDQTFRTIHEEFEFKLRTIGAHIFEIREQDVAPAEKAASVPYELAHSLPIEMDLHRLAIRAQNLDETLAMLRDSRLEDVTRARERVDQALHPYSSDIKEGQYVVEGLLTASEIQNQLILGVRAQPCGSEPIRLESEATEFDPLRSAQATAAVAQQARHLRDRSATPGEIVELGKAAAALRSRRLISAEAAVLFEDFLGSGSLKILETQHVG